MIGGGHSVYNSPATNIFPSLVELSMCSVTLSSTFFASFPTTWNAPKLRALATAYLADPSYKAISYASLSPEVIDRLEILVLGVSGMYNGVYNEDGSPPPCLVLRIPLGGDPYDRPFDHLDFPLPPVLRLILYSTPALARIEDVQDLIRDNLTYLSERLDSAQQGDQAHEFIFPPHLGSQAEHSQEFRDLQATIARIGGRIVREEREPPEFASLVSPRVWCEARRKKQEAREGGPEV
jgi:hypothetical protein